MMKRASIGGLLALSALVPALSQVTAPVPPAEPVAAAAPVLPETPAIPATPAEGLARLSPAQRADFQQALEEARQLYTKKQHQACLARLDQAEQIFASSPELFHLRGVCHAQTRDFAPALESFLKADQLAPGRVSILFNIAEVKFVTKDWEGAQRAFQHLVTRIGTDPQQQEVVRLADFRILIARIKLGDLAGAKELQAKHAAVRDSPYPYFAAAVIHTEEGDRAAAKADVLEAGRIFPQHDEVAPWWDTLVESGYL